MSQALTNGPFDDIRASDIRFLEEAAKLGPLTVQIWSDDRIRSKTGADPKFSAAERRYFLESVRFVSNVIDDDQTMSGNHIRVARESANRDPTATVIAEAALHRFPPPPICPENPRSDRKKVLVTGCFDWFHSGHVRFFEEVSGLGDLYVVVGHDANIRLLKGEGHPLLPAEERRYVAGAIRYATMALISSGDGWLDAEPEVDRLKPDIYAVNEDGDRPEKAEFCRRKGVEYRVLKRVPKAGLPKRSSTDLRGF